MYNLTSQEIQNIITILKNYSTIKSAIIFGSRALGTSEKTSDIDIAIKGANTSTIIGQLKGSFEASYLPYFVDIVNYETLSNKNLQKHIDTEGKILY